MFREPLDGPCRYTSGIDDRQQAVRNQHFVAAAPAGRIAHILLASARRTPEFLAEAFSWVRAEPLREAAICRTGSAWFESLQFTIPKVRSPSRRTGLSLPTLIDRSTVGPVEFAIQSGNSASNEPCCRTGKADSSVKPMMVVTALPARGARRCGSPPRNGEPGWIGIVVGEPRTASGQHRIETPALRTSSAG